MSPSNGKELDQLSTTEWPCLNVGEIGNNLEDLVSVAIYS